VTKSQKAKNQETESRKSVEKNKQTKIHRIFEVEKMYLNKFVSSFDELNLDINKKLHCSVRTLANPEASEWFFSYISNGETMECFSRSKNVTDVVSHVVSHDKMGNVSHATLNLEDQLNSADFNNYEIMNNIMLQNMLELVNYEKANDPRYKEMLANLTYEFNSIFRGLTIYLTALGSWFDGYMYYPPGGVIKISDSHAYQFLVASYGEEKSVGLMHSMENG